jgi:sulfate adenylyltransferase subunit 1
MPWYKDKRFSFLEALEPEEKDVSVQTVIRPKQKNHDFRGYAGKLYGNNIKVGDAVTVLPFFNRIKVSKIHFLINFEAIVVLRLLELENDINVTRGDMIVKSSELPK